MCFFLLHSYLLLLCCYGLLHDTWHIMTALICFHCWPNLSLSKLNIFNMLNGFEHAFSWQSSHCRKVSTGQESPAVCRFPACRERTRPRCGRSGLFLIPSQPTVARSQWVATSCLTLSLWATVDSDPGATRNRHWAKWGESRKIQCSKQELLLYT